MTLIQLPPIQKNLGETVSEILSEELATKCKVGRVNLGFLNRIVLDDVLICDQQQKPMISAARMAAKINIIDLLEGKLSITSAQLFGMQGNIYRKDSISALNCQFLLDALASEDTTSQEGLNMSIGSLIVRRSSIHYHDYSIPPSHEHFNANHLEISDLSAHVILSKLTDDSIALNVKNLSLKESSGLTIDKFSFKATADKTQGSIEDLEMKMPNSVLRIPKLEATYQFNDDRFQEETLQFNGSITQSIITPSEFTPFSQTLKSFEDPFFITSSFQGTCQSLQVNHLLINSGTEDFFLHAKGTLNYGKQAPRWTTIIERMDISDTTVKKIVNIDSTALAPLTRFGRIQFKGKLGGTNDILFTEGKLSTDAGSADLALDFDNRSIKGHLKTTDFNIGRILNDDQFGLLVTDIQLDGFIPQTGLLRINSIKGDVQQFYFNGYNYSNIQLDGSLIDKQLLASASIDDPNAKVSLQANINLGNHPSISTTADVTDLNPNALKISESRYGARFSGTINADIRGSSPDNAIGTISVNDFVMKPQQSNETTYTLDNLTIRTVQEDGNKIFTLDSDFATISLNGHYRYSEIYQSLINVLASRIPTMPWLPATTKSNECQYILDATISENDWITTVADIPLTLNEPIHISGIVNEKSSYINIDIKAPHFFYDGDEYRNATLSARTQTDGHLQFNSQLSRQAPGNQPLDLILNADVGDNQLNTNIEWDTNSLQPIKGTLNTTTEFYRLIGGKPAVHIHVHPSDILVNDTIWRIESSDISYSDKDLTFDNFAIRNNKQHIIVNGKANDTPEDSLLIDLRNVNVDYILDLVEFDAVSFSGYATGKAYIKSTFSQPDAYADLTVQDFHFEQGRMGTLTAHVDYNKKEKQIDIHALAHDGHRKTHVNGYISPQRNYIDLAIGADSTNLEFLKSFCGSFMDNINASGTGQLRLYGDLDQINLTGNVLAKGQFDITPLGTRYTITEDTIKLIPNQIVFDGLEFHDRDGHSAYLSGALYHQYLTKLTYQLHIDANNLLSYDTRTYADNTFYGTIYATGTCDIQGGDQRIDFNINATPQAHSFIEYDAASPDAVTNQQFITWRDRGRQQAPDISPSDGADEDHVTDSDDSPTDMHINFLINTTPDFNLRVLMDKTYGDHISLNGNGTLRATYHNLGSFDMFGNYTVEQGYYRFTIQNLLQKEFKFQQGGTIVFRGNPYNAKLTLPALYTVNGASLADLYAGDNFAPDNVRVDCLMNIAGTPAAPVVTFDLQLPTVSADANQMVRSLINSQQEMNQQVLYLLSIGRFYNPRPNNAQQNAPQSQASLAMQSFISGTISQQISNALRNVVKNNDWNFGANIATGNDGFSNAEYEGLLSGRLLNNRLTINGQFGYRDNPNTTSAFIGDFDIRYLLTHNGNIAVKVYNQANERYFTRNTLNTQGIGVIMKKDFNQWKELFTKRKRKRTDSNKK